MSVTIDRIPVHQRPALENSIHYLAHTFSFLAKSTDTDMAYALIHCHFRKGFTPPPHLHQFEDESFYLLEGEMSFHVGDKKFNASVGELVILPKGIPHEFKLVSETAKALLLILPGGFEEAFREFGRPAQTLDLPPIPENLDKMFFENMHQRMTELGIVWIPDF